MVCLCCQLCRRILSAFCNRSMNDVDGPEVAEQIYRRLFGCEGHLLDPDVIPYALADAAKALRDRGVSPGRWATYIHVGI